jgi:ABC-type sugar transport system permease subunit
MVPELMYPSWAGTGLSFGLLAFAAVLWQQGKRRKWIGVARMIFVLLATILATAVAFVLLMFLADLAGFRGLERMIQPLGIVAGVVGWFAGNKLAARFSVSPLHRT